MTAITEEARLLRLGNADAVPVRDPDGLVPVGAGSPSQSRGCSTPSGGSAAGVPTPATARCRGWPAACG